MNEQEQKEFEELSTVVKATGYMSLDSQEKRKRYSELKSKFTESSEVLSITRGELQAMIDKSVQSYKNEAKKSFTDSEEEGLDEAKRLGKWIKSKQIKKENPTAKMKLYREDGFSEAGLIIDWKFLKKAFNEETRKYDIDIERITVLYDKGVTKTYEIPLLQLVQINEFETVEIIKQNVEEQEMSQGRGMKAYTKGGYSFSDPGFFGTKGQIPGDSFEYMVTKKEVECTVKRPSGDTLVVNVDRLNQ